MIPLCPLCLSSGLILHDPPSPLSEFPAGYYSCPRCKALFSLDSAVKASSAGMQCRVCLCTDKHACPGSCSWVAIDLCSRCA